MQVALSKRQLKSMLQGMGVWDMGHGSMGVWDMGHGSIGHGTWGMGVWDMGHGAWVHRKAFKLCILKLHVI